MLRWILIFSALLLLTGCGTEKPMTPEEVANLPYPQRTDLPTASGSATLSIGDQTITSNQIVMPLLDNYRKTARQSNYEQFETAARQSVEQQFVSRLASILLYQKARAELKNIDEGLDKAVDDQIDRYVASFQGDMAKAEEDLKKMGHDWESYRDYQKKMMLTQYYISTKIPPAKPIAHSELLDYYDHVKKDEFIQEAMIEFQLIDINITKMETSGDRKNESVKLAKELIAQIQDGADFGELAIAHSHGHRKIFSGNWKPVKPDSLAPPYDTLVKTVEEMKVGDISGPIEAGDHVFIMKLKNKQDNQVQSFEEVQALIEARLKEKNIQEARMDFNRKFLEQLQVGDYEHFIDLCIQRLYLLSYK